MSFNIRTQKWGDTQRGTESGEIEWSMNLSADLKMIGGTSLVDYENAMRAAFNRWEEVADLDFQLVGNSGGDISVGMELLAGSTVGRAIWNGGPTITFGEVQMDSEVTWSPFGNGGGTSFYAVALHEIGHILGFDHVMDTTEIMNDFVSRNNLGDGDISGAQVLYGTRDTAADPDDPSNTPISDRVTDDPGLNPGGDSGGDGGGGGAGIILALLGVLAAIFGFGFGGGAAAAASGVGFGALKEAPEDDEEAGAGCDCAGPCDCGAQDDLELLSHNVYLTEADFLAAGDSHDHGHDHGGCDHEGPCDCHLKSEQTSDDVVLLTDIIPVTGILDECASCGPELMDDEMEDDLMII